MIDKIDNPMAEALVRWLTADEGGRRSGPPTAPVYAATAVFALGDDAELNPGWPAMAEKLSILLEPSGVVDKDGRRPYWIDFLVRDLACQHMKVGQDLLITEGPRVVASARITSTFQD